MIRSDIVTTVEPRPYAHAVMGDALCDYPSLQRDFPDESRFGAHIRSHGDLTYPDAEYCRLMETSDAYRRLHEWVYSASFCSYFLDMFRSDIDAQVASGALLRDPFGLPIRPQPYEGRNIITRTRVPDDVFVFPRLDLGIGRAGYGKVNGGRGIHIDNATRIVSILIYIGDTRMTGGEHRLYDAHGENLVLDKVYPPRPNSLIASLQSNVAFHDVNPVTEISGVRKAFYLAVSCSTDIWAPPSGRLAQFSGSRHRRTFWERTRARFRSFVST